LFFFIERLNDINESLRRKAEQSERRIVFSEANNEGSVKVGGAVDLELVGVGVSGELGPVALQEQNMEAYSRLEIYLIPIS
jgi:hypothetical protein